MAKVRLPAKKDMALALLEGDSVKVHLDPRRPRVVVPKWYLTQPRLILQIGYNMAVPIADLAVGDRGITCTLSFNHAPFWCRLPWSAIYALVGEDNKGMIWPQDVPSEVMAEMTGLAPPAPARKPRAKPNGPRPKRRKEPPAEVSIPAATDGVSDAKTDGQSSAPPQGRTLRVVPQRAAPATEHVAVTEADTEPKRKKSRIELPPYLRVIK